MPRQPWIADQLRDYGLTVIEEPGWKVRGPWTFEPQGVVVHHTASRRGSDVPSLRIVTHGRSDLTGPLCAVLIGRSGVCHVIAAGRANHAGRGGYRGLTGNSSVLGIEAENDGIGEPWPDHQLAVFHRATAALLDGINRDYSWCCGHKEWTTRKIDPAGIDMNDFRRSVALLLKQGEPMPADRTELIKQAQQALNANGADPALDVDGDFGPLTAAALTAVLDTLNSDINQMHRDLEQCSMSLEGCKTDLLDAQLEIDELPYDIADAQLGRTYRAVVNSAITGER